MQRLTLRIPDATMAALRRKLDQERSFRGQRYSMNDLCTLLLGISTTQHAPATTQPGDGTLHVIKSLDYGTLQIVPPPPPPPPPPLPDIHTYLEQTWPQSPEPQPERSAR